MSSSRYQPEQEWESEPDAGSGWRPDPPWEPEPDSNPWSDRGRPDEGEPGTELPAPRVGTVGAGPSYALAYLGAAAVLVVSFGLGVVTVGLHTRFGLAKTFLGVGAALVAFGMVTLALTVWLAGGLERG